MLIKIILLIMTFVVGVVSIGGETWIKGTDGHKGRITQRGWIAILAIAITVLLNAWKDNRADKMADDQRAKQDDVVRKLTEIANTSKDAKQKEHIAALALDQLFSLNRSAVVKVEAQIGSEHREKSGFFVNSEGYVLTADYAVTQPGRPDIPVSSVNVQDSRGNVYPAKVIKVDPGISTALLKIDQGSLYYLRLARQDPDADDQILVIGSTEQEFLTRTTGKVMSLDGDTGLYSRDRDFLPGFGGGPMLNLDGDVIGLNWGALVPPKPGIAKFVKADSLRQLIIALKIKI